MKLDSEKDRGLLLGLIHESTLRGSDIFVIGDLVKRIQVAQIEKPAEPPAEKPVKKGEA
ncbi:hypothetical protein QTA58_00185 [Neorhizobium sp. CSC1952]|uniref:hypothetical protein n=1 Tax=Neorhizobium sp. CSC1952 TaxID=2978974 RepID=UPI0025A54FB4|nr:hypothetical protein [Rhizobium sp. CSC1952]WJR67227.1 hypothetical protein QTA58_00185 [Rhizobium sp. CSC1952]